jgi:signal transduction histidine kinase
MAARRLLAVTEEELQRIVLDIHDGPVQTLFAVLGRLASLQARLAGVSPELAAELDRVTRQLEGALADIRNLLGVFRSPLFTQRDLARVLEDVVAQHEDLTGQTVVFECPPSLPPVSLAVRIALYRVLQEALANAFRHARVPEVQVTVRATRRLIRLEVADKGPGFVPPPLEGPQATEDAAHIGLRGMRERVLLVGGSFSLESAPGQGTRIRVEVPVRA